MQRKCAQIPLRLLKHSSKSELSNSIISNQGTSIQILYRDDIYFHQTSMNRKFKLKRLGFDL